MDSNASKRNEAWPELPYASWSDTRETLHRWLQIVGKIRLAKTPWCNHSWQSALYLTGRGLTTSLIHDGERAFTIDLDFVSHDLQIHDTRGQRFGMALVPMSVARFYEQLFGALDALRIEPRIDGAPNELADRLPFRKDEGHCSYDPEAVRRFWRALVSAHRVMQEFGSRYVGKMSPIHLFWGSLDLAVTRFSGRRAPQHPGGVPNLPDLVAREAYSHEVSSCGFWPGDARLPYAAFYSYCYPEPAEFKNAQGLPDGAFYHEQLHEFILPYENVRKSERPEEMLMNFFQATYLAASRGGKWDVEALEHSEYLIELQARHDRQNGAAA